MSDPKLFVMQKKFIKFIKTSLLKSAREKFLVDVIGRDSKGFRNRLLFHKQQRLRKSHQPFGRSSCRRKDRSLGRAFGAVFRSLDTSRDHRFAHLPLVTTFWRALLPQPAKDQRELRTLWIRSASEDSIPRLSRGFKLNSNDPPDPSCTPCTHNTWQNADEFDRTFERLTEQCDGTAEQRYYTEDPTSTKPLPTPQRPLQHHPEGDRQLPPPLRCRLSCPLPPLAFIPPEDTHTLPTHRPPAARFSLPPDFPPPDRPAKDTATDPPAMRPRDHPKKTSPPAPSSLDLPELLPKPVRNKKTYSALKQLKSRLHQPQPEVVPKMKALLFEPDSLALNYDAVNAPTKIYKDEVLVQVTYSGVCGTDLFITEGKVSCGPSPVILGHEISGKVYAVGSDVAHVAPGDNIAVNAYTACCVCRYCSRGFYSACENDGLDNSIGISKNGGWAEFVVVKKSQVHKVPEELSLDQAALVQPLSCVLSALSKLNISHGMDVLILGLGLSGCLWASVLHSRGLKNVWVSEKSEKKREQFECLELGYAFVPTEDIGKVGVDVIIECTGSPTSIEKAFNVLNPNGQMCFFGKPNPMTEVRCIPYEIIKKEITIVGNAGNAFCFSKAIDLATSMGQQYLDFEKLGVRVFDLEDYREAFQLKKLGEVGKIMFKFDS